jgi:hypothetical protein
MAVFRRPCRTGSDRVVLPVLLMSVGAMAGESTPDISLFVAGMDETSTEEAHGRVADFAARIQALRGESCGALAHASIVVSLGYWPSDRASFAIIDADIPPDGARKMPGRIYVPVNCHIALLGPRAELGMDN